MWIWPLRRVGTSPVRRRTRCEPAHQEGSHTHAHRMRAPCALSTLCNATSDTAAAVPLCAAADRYVTENGVTCIGYTDINSRLSSTSSTLYANNQMKWILSTGKRGSKQQQQAAASSKQQQESKQQQASKQQQQASKALAAASSSSRQTISPHHLTTTTTTHLRPDDNKSKGRVRYRP